MEQSCPARTPLSPSPIPQKQPDPDPGRDSQEGDLPQSILGLGGTGGLSTHIPTLIAATAVH